MKDQTAPVPKSVTLSTNVTGLSVRLVHLVREQATEAENIATVERGLTAARRNQDVRAGRIAELRELIAITENGGKR